MTLCYLKICLWCGIKKKRKERREEGLYLTSENMPESIQTVAGPVLSLQVSHAVLAEKLTAGDLFVQLGGLLWGKP